MRILGLTGDIACGKSTVARLLKERGAEVLDSDLLVREIYADTEFAALVQELFQTPVVDSHGGVDRGKLAPLVFGDKPALAALEKLVFPAVATLREGKFRELKALGRKVVVIEAVKLLESGQGSGCNAIWCVVCSREVQLHRLMHDRGLNEVAAIARLDNQPSRERKLDLAGETPLVWIENDGTLADLKALVEKQWVRFLA